MNILQNHLTTYKYWRKKHDYSTIYIDFAPTGSFEAFMNDEPIPLDDDF